MKTFSFEIEYDEDYGIDHRNGWSICIDGSYAVQLEPSLPRAIVKALRSWMRWEKV